MAVGQVWLLTRRIVATFMLEIFYARCMHVLFTRAERDHRVFPISYPSIVWSLCVQPIYLPLILQANTDICLVCPQCEYFQPTAIAKGSKSRRESCVVRPEPIKGELPIIQVALEYD